MEPILCLIENRLRIGFKCFFIDFLTAISRKAVHYQSICFCELHDLPIDLVTGKLPEPNLLVNTPPGSSKSLIASVFWPAWEWLWAPWTRWLTSSYDDALALRDAVRTRTLICDCLP